MDNKFPGKDISLSDLKDKIPLVTKKGRKIVDVNGVIFGGEKIPIFAGPNMVESQELIIEAAIKLKKIGVDFLRGGAYKPLTFPYRSEKYNETGSLGLNWLLDAKKASGIQIITEAMSEDHLEAVAEVADIIQIGSRNMQNFPFLVKVARTKKPIMLKRHYGSSLRDWMGAAEYILLEGNDNLILCERGVSAPHTHRNTSRFLLDLQIIPALKEISELPIVTDPSHATFWRNWVEPMSLASVAAGADGVMVEVHPDPENAAVDPLQPIDYNAFSRLFEKMSKVAKAINRRLY